MIRPRVLGDRVLLKPLDASETTDGGVLLPDVVREKESRGIVLEVGEDTQAPVEIGDIVVYAERGTRHYGQPVAVSIDREEGGVSEDLIVVEYADLLLILEEPA